MLVNEGQHGGAAIVNSQQEGLNVSAEWGLSVWCGSSHANVSFLWALWCPPAAKRHAD